MIRRKRIKQNSSSFIDQIAIYALGTFRKRADDGFHITAIFDLVDPYPKRQISGIFIPVCQSRIAEF